MKVAMCLCGLTNGYEKSFIRLGEKILPKYQPDIYIHSWEQNENIIKDILYKYKPVKYIFEPQKDFKNEINHLSSSEYDVQNVLYSCDLGSSIFTLLSYTYSRKKNFEQITDSYDLVIICRFDVLNWRNQDPPDDLSILEFNQSIDINKIYLRYWNQLNSGLAEQWFYCSQENMKIICNLYNELFKYLEKDSNYINDMIINGWPLSNMDHEFSNEMLKPIEERSKRLAILPKEAINNAHCLYKYHFYKNNLLDKCEFIY